ncbi:MAG TPA: serine hydrolase [Methyloceanibacter sp.]|nr:serine hydrolase [Methyloceanibacter sp.]
MISFKRRTWLMLAAIAAAALVAGVFHAYRVARVGSGVSAELLCGGVFVSGRAAEDVKAEDLTGPGYELLRFFQETIDSEAKRVTASAYGFAPQTAVYRQGFGCTLIDGASEAELRKQAQGLAVKPSADAEALWPEGERVDLGAVADGVDRAALDTAVAANFAEPDPSRPRNTRALVVVHRGRIVAERYAPGFAAAMPLVGWSMTKGALNALIGMRVKDGKLAVADRALMPEWRGEGDERRDITLDDLLRMSSGLAFDESYDDPLADVTVMLFARGDMAKFAADKQLLHPPSTHWSYASGTSNIVAGILRATFPNDEDYLRYPRERLFAPLGMGSAVVAPDASGTLVGSSLLYASARDFARLGLLYLQDGVWQGTRLLPEGWVAYSLTPAKDAPEQSYGAHMWLKLPQSDGYGEPPMPDDAYYFLGHDEQIIAIVPSRDLVIVRLGRTLQKGAWDPAKELAPIVNAFPTR